MKKLTLIAALLLTACATEKPVFQDDNHMPVQPEKRFIGDDADDIEDRFGKPLVIRKEGENQLWTYRQNGCIAIFYFDADKEVRHAERRGDCPRLHRARRDII